MKTSRTILIAALSLVLTGCVSKKQYAELQTTHNALKDKYASLDKDYQDAKVQIATFTSDSKSLAARLAEEQQRNRDLQAAYGKLQASYTENVSQEIGRAHV